MEGKLANGTATGGTKTSKINLSFCTKPNRENHQKRLKNGELKKNKMSIIKGKNWPKRKYKIKPQK
jgi:hypothetical protein